LLEIKPTRAHADGRAGQDRRARDAAERVHRREAAARENRRGSARSASRSGVTSHALAREGAAWRSCEAATRDRAPDKCSVERLPHAAEPP
jgi:hypothetical protein